MDCELTPDEAADLLNVLQPYPIRLLDEGVIPSRMVGAHRWTRAADAPEYKQERDRRRDLALYEIRWVSDELGLCHR